MGQRTNLLNERKPDTLLVELLVHSHQFCSLIRFDSIPRSWVALGPDDWKGINVRNSEMNMENQKDWERT